VTGDWRKLHNEKLHNLYFSPSIQFEVKEDEMGRACSTNGGDAENRILVEKARRKETARKT
jgi:hypothetical protein